MASLPDSVSLTPDYTSERLKVWRNHFTSESGAKLVTAPFKKDLPKRTGLLADRIIIGHFTWKAWALRDDYGRFATKEAMATKLI